MRDPRRGSTAQARGAAAVPRLRRNGQEALGPVHDRELLELLRHVAARRHARAVPAGGGEIQVAPSRDAAEPQSAARRDALVAQPSGAPGTVLELVPVAQDVRILRLVRPAGFDFAPGQYVKLGVPGGGRNSYTIASSPDEPHLEFCIEQRPGGRVSPRLFAMRAGDRVVLDARAKGSFTLVESARVHVMVATVTGIAPFRSMLRHAAGRDAWPSRVVVLHGASFADELAYRAELETLAERSAGRLNYLPSVSRPTDPRNAGFDGATGRVTDLITGVLADLGSGVAGLQVYACGNPGMVATLRQQMTALRVPLAAEAFG
jgi:ferredoxin-NADP reductase